METKICLKWLLTRGWKQWNTLNRLISKNLVAVVCWREVVLHKRLQRKILVFWIGGRLSKRGGRTLRFDCIYVYFLSKSLLLVLWSDYNNNEEKTEQASHKKWKTLWKSPVCTCNVLARRCFEFPWWHHLVATQSEQEEKSFNFCERLNWRETSWQAKIITFSCCSVNFIYKRLVFIF